MRILHRLPVWLSIGVIFTSFFSYNQAFSKDRLPILLGGSITNNPLNQTIASGSSPALLTASVASGGHGTNVYQWEKSDDNITFKGIVGATGQNYQAGPLYANTYFRRKVTCGLETAYTSNIAFVTVILAPGYITPATSNVNYNGFPPTMTLNGVSGQSGTYSYQWQKSTDGVNFTNISNATSSSYTSSVSLLITTFYRVSVSSNGSSDYSVRATDVVCASADAGPDVTVCPNSSATIGTPAITGYTYSWSPTTGLNNANIAQPTASPSTTTNYTLTMAPSNLFTNGDFELGLTGFSTDYGTWPNGNGTGMCAGHPGSITVTTDPHTLGIPEWCSKTDHSPVGNQMLAIDASCTANSRIWFQTVTVLPNTDYNFSGWACPNGYDYGQSQYVPVLRVRINGTNVIQNFSVLWDPLGCTNWTQFATVWNSGSSTTATIEIIDDNLNPSGNDFSLDDLSFANCATTTDNTTATVYNGAVSISPIGPITYYNDYEAVHNFPLTATPSSSYQWYSNNVLIPGATSQTYNVPLNSTISYTANYKCVTACGTSNTVNLNYIACQFPSDYPVSVPDWRYPNCSSTFPLTLTQPNLGAGTTYQWSFWNNPSCYSFSNQSGNSVQLTSSGCAGDCIFTRAIAANGAETRMLFCFNENQGCRIMNPGHENPSLTLEDSSSKSKPALSSIQNHIPQKNSGNKVSLQPNPANTKVMVTANSGISSIVLFNMAGVYLKQMKANGSRSFTVAVDNLPSGVYYLKIDTGTGSQYLKLLIQR